MRPRIFWSIFLFGLLILAGSIFTYLDRRVWNNDLPTLLPHDTEFWLRYDFDSRGREKLTALLGKVPNGGKILTSPFFTPTTEVLQWAQSQPFTQVNLAQVNDSILVAGELTDGQIFKDLPVSDEETFLSEKITSTDVFAGGKFFVWRAPKHIFLSDKADTIKSLISNRYYSQLTRRTNWRQNKSPLANLQNSPTYRETFTRLLDSDSFLTVYAGKSNKQSLLFVDGLINSLNSAYGPSFDIIAPNLELRAPEPPYAIGIEALDSDSSDSYATVHLVSATPADSNRADVNIDLVGLVNERQLALGEEDSNIWRAASIFSNALPVITLKSSLSGSGNTTITTITLEFRDIPQRSKDEAEKILARVSQTEQLGQDLLPVIRDSARRADAEIVENSIAQFKKFSGRAPVSLDELVPGFVSSLPSDPLLGRPYEYQNTGADQTFFMQIIFETEGEWGKAGVYCLTSTGFSSGANGACQER